MTPSQINRLAQRNNAIRENTLRLRDTWQTKMRGGDNHEYQLYCELSDEKPLKSFEEWLAS
jgi:hypothetical protein